ncbi:MAG TPA: hypothetical protein VGL75_08735 [Acidothermaceae bacterium]
MPGTSASKKSAFSGTAVLAIVTAGVLLAGCASKNSAAGSGGKPPKLLIGTGSSAGAADAPMIAAAGVAPGAVAPQPVGGFAGFGGYVVAGTLPTTPTHAPIYTWQSGKASEADVMKLAAAFGLTGTPTRHSHGWDLKTSGGELRVRDDEDQQWSYARADALDCPAYQTDIDNGDGVSTGFACATSAPVPPVASPGTAISATPATPVTPVQGPDETATKTAAASLLSTLGVTGDEQFNQSSPASTLSVSPQIDGMPTQGIETDVDVDAQGIRAATGRLVAPKAGDDYPLQTAAAAFKSLADRPVPAIAMYCGPLRGGPVLPVPVASGPDREPLAPSASAVPAPVASGPNTKFPLNPAASASPNTVLVASPPPVPVSGPAVGSVGPVAVPPVESSYPCPTPKPQKVTGAVIGLQVEYNASGATTAADGSTSGGTNILVPTWFFTVEGSTDPLTVVAIDPSFLGDQTPIPPVGAPAASTSAGFEGSGGGASANSGTVAVPPAPPSGNFTGGPAIIVPTPATKS